MILSLMLVFSQCHPSLVTPYVDAVQQQQVAYAQVYAVWRVGEDEYQNQMLEKLTAIAEQNQQIVQALRANSTAPAGPVESQVERDARNILQAKCISCHKGADAKGDIDLSGPLSVNQKLLVEEVVRSGQMPPKPAKELDDESFASIRAWAHEDAKAVRAALKTPKNPGQGK